MNKLSIIKEENKSYITQDSISSESYDINNPEEKQIKSICFVRLKEYIGGLTSVREIYDYK